MVEARGLHKSLPSVKIVYCTMEVKLMIKKQESLREFYQGHFCLGNPRGRVVFINKFVGRHENLFYCKYSLEMKTRCNE